MPGRGGTLTNEALRQREPRIVLAEVEWIENDGGNPTMRVIFRENQGCFKGIGSGSDLSFHDGERFFNVRTLAKSFSVSYLLTMGRVNRRIK
jgi:hypothetical protein